MSRRNVCKSDVDISDTRCVTGVRSEGVARGVAARYPASGRRRRAKRPNGEGTRARQKTTAKRTSKIVAPR